MLFLLYNLKRFIKDQGGSNRIFNSRKVEGRKLKAVNSFDADWDKAERQRGIDRGRGSFLISQVSFQRK
jgi:hypothetical protein